jgi:LysM repeat protein
MRIFPLRLRNILAGGLIALILLAAGLVPAHAQGRAKTPADPPTLSLSVLVLDGSPSFCQEGEAVLRFAVRFHETLIVSAPGASTSAVYTVQPGDTLNSIADAHHLSLQQLENANPQLSWNGRSFDLIFPGDLIQIPGQGPQPLRLLLVSRAPQGPRPPALTPIPSPSPGSTQFLAAQHQHEVAAIKQANQRRVDHWRSTIRALDRAWQRQLLSHFSALVCEQSLPAASSQAAAQALQNDAATLQGLPKPRTLLVLGAQPPPPATNIDLSGTKLVVADIDSPAQRQLWSAFGHTTHAASVSILTSALTQLQLPRRTDG